MGKSHLKGQWQKIYLHVELVLDRNLSSYTIHVSAEDVLTCEASFIRKRECSDSVVECLTQDRGAVGSSLTGVTALWSLSKTHLSWFSTGSTQKTHPCLTERLLMGHIESNRTKTNKNKIIKKGLMF